MKCSKCGTKNAVFADYCKSCGEKLTPEPSKEITVVSDKLKLDESLIMNRFKVIRKLGKGGMGEVFLAEDLKLKRNVAVKSITTDTLSDSSSRARFLREAQTASQLDHPNICTVYEIYEEDYHDYIVMKYVDGVSLDQILRVKPLSINKTLDIALQVCSGMMEAHDSGIIHRDIKPGNIMVDKKGVVNILDFGLAKFGSKTTSKADEMEDLNLTEKGIVLGTVAYLSPEQASGKPVDHQTDVFSFGVLLYEMLEGKNPFKEDEQIETLYNVLNKKVEFSRQIPEELERIIRKALEKDKKNRYFSFSQLKNDLEQFRSDYNKWREEQASDNAGAGTEVIDSREQEKLLKELQGTSDNEGLGDLVNKIRGFKASTERVYTTGRKRIKWFAFPVLIILILAAGFYIVKEMIINKEDSQTAAGAGPTFYIYLQPFENKTGERNLADKVNYLLTESLNQFKEFKAISKEEATSILENQKNDKVDLEKLSGKFKVSHELTGKITVLSGYYTIEGTLSPMDKTRKEQRLTITGRGKDSILINQVDNLSRRVYKIFFPTKTFDDFGFKKISRIYGTDWKTFSDFYLGDYYNNRLESDKAKRYLLKAPNLLISKYSLADLLYFSGDRSKALKLVNDLVRQIDFLTEPMKHRVLALKARLDFDFAREIKNLEKLKNDFLFSKEVFLELGEAYFHKGNAEKALEYYKKALELKKNYSEALNHMGYCYSYLGNHTKAIQAFEEYRTLDRTANSFDSLGDGYFYAGQLVDSESLKGLAVSTDEKSVPWAYITLGDINILKARYKEAENALRKYQLLRRTSEYKAEVLAKQAYIYYVNKEYEKALDTINRSLDTFDSADITNETAEAHWLRGIILLDSGQYEDSHLELDWLEDFTEKYKLSRENFSQPFKYYIHLEALILENNGEIAKADENFKFLVSMKPRLSYWTTYYNYQFFHTEYAAFFMRNEKYREALQEIDLCLEFNRNYIPALWLKADILEKSDDLQRETVYRKIAELYGEAAENNYLRNRLKEKLQITINKLQTNSKAPAGHPL